MKSRILIKLGGSSLQNAGTLKELAVLIKGFQKDNYQIVVVHGGGPAINEELTKRGIQWKFINGQRQTTPEMISVIEEVLAVKVNSMLVQLLNAAGLEAYGLSGAHEQTLLCTQANEELMQVGKIETVNTAAIEAALEISNAALTVVAPIGVGSQGEKYNINADWAATQIAKALKVEKLIFLTDQDGILDQDKKLVGTATSAKVNEMIKSGVISGGMYTKVMTMMSALEAGIEQVRVLNASQASLILKSDSTGTLLVKELVKKDQDASWKQSVI
ncbi:MAG: acetylglutamate kinase [Pseudobdellovibrio sp.]